MIGKPSFLPPPHLQALPILNEALAALDTIDEKDINYIKKLGNPPAIIKIVLEVIKRCHYSPKPTYAPCRPVHGAHSP